MLKNKKGKSIVTVILVLLLLLLLGAGVFLGFHMWKNWEDAQQHAGGKPTPTQGVTPTEEVTPSPTGEVTPTEEVTPSPTGEVTPTEEVTPSPTGEVTPTEEVTPSPTGEVTPTEEVTPTPTSEVTPTPTGEVTVEYTYTEKTAVMYTKENVNVRDLPSTSGDKIGILGAGKEVKVTGQCVETGWYRISYKNMVGYVSDRYVTDEKPAEPTPKPTPEPTPTATPEPTAQPTPTPTQAPSYTYTDMDAVMYAKESVNIRSLPSTAGEVLSALNEGQEVKVTGQCVENGWYRIVYYNSVGYVSGRYLTNEKPAEVTTAPSATPEPTAAPTQQPVVTPKPTEQPTVTPTQAPKYTYTEMDTVMYAKESVNIRSLPSTAGDIVSGLNTGQEVKVTGRCVETGWYRVIFYDIVGYVSGGYLVNEKPVESAAEPSTEPTPQPTTVPPRSRNLSTERIAFSFGAAKNGKPHNITVENQKAFDAYDLNALAWDNKSKEKVLYLTFDCGYKYGDLVNQILDTLKAKKVKATFFCVLDFVQEASSEVKRMIAEGHNVGNHTATHPDCTKISREKMADNLARLDNYMETNFNYQTKYFRFPEGAYSESALDVAYQEGYRSVFWSIAHADWDPENQPGTDVTLKTLKNRLHPGAVILLHAMSSDNAEVLGEFIDYARSQGYVFRSLDQYNYWK